jgi:uncharacterized repeat protein (TIGR03803 family)
MFEDLRARPIDPPREPGQEAGMLKICATIAAALLSVAMCAFAPAAQANGFKVMYAFAGPPGDGDKPSAGVTFDTAGNLYGTTYYGGASNNGTIFKIDRRGNETLLHSFDGSTGGAYPLSSLAINVGTGDLYGTTQAGGNATCNCGVLYKLAANGTFSVLHTFAANRKNGAGPQRQLLRDKKGNLYGVTQGGGAFRHGTVFEYPRRGRFTILHSFNARNAQPTGGVVQDREGNLYGVTGVGGATKNCSGHGCGSIFELGPDGTFVTLYSFLDGNDGRYPVGGLTIDNKGDLYGTTSFGGPSGGGTVFIVGANRQFATLLGFNGANGDSPLSAILLLNRDLYVTTYDGGTDSMGTITRVSPKGVAKVLHSFTGDDGAYVIGGLVENNSVLYGTTSSHGANDHGTVFRLKLP